MANLFPSFRLKNQASAPASPASGVSILYTKTDGKLYRKNSAGTETRIGHDAPYALTYGASTATDASQSSHFRVTLTGDTNLSIPTNPTDGQRGLWEFNATGATRTVTLVTTGAGSFKLGANITVATIAVPSGAKGFMGAVYCSDTGFWHVLAVDAGV